MSTSRAIWFISSCHLDEQKYFHRSSTQGAPRSGFVLRRSCAALSGVRSAHDLRQFIMVLGANVDSGSCLGGGALDSSRGLCRCVVPRRRQSRMESYRTGAHFSDCYWTALLWHRVDDWIGRL